MVVSCPYVRSQLDGRKKLGGRVRVVALMEWVVDLDVKSKAGA